MKNLADTDIHTDTDSLVELADRFGWDTTTLNVPGSHTITRLDHHPHTIIVNRQPDGTLQWATLWRATGDGDDMAAVTSTSNPAGVVGLVVAHGTETAA